MNSEAVKVKEEVKKRGKLGKGVRRCEGKEGIILREEEPLPRTIPQPYLIALKTVPAFPNYRV